MDKIIQAFQDDGAEWLYPIVFFLVAGLAIAFERIYFIAVRSNINGVALMSIVKNAIMNQKYVEAIKTCNAEEQKGKVLPKVLKAGLQKAETGSPEEIKAAMEQATLEVYPTLSKRALFLPVIANLATLAGLLGTIVGLIDSFAALADAPADQKQEMLARGIATAMNTTAGGLICAIPILLLNAFVQFFTNKIMDEVDQYSAQCLNLIVAQKKSGGASASK
jgi:biopolymer transport protein ExbB